MDQGAQFQIVLVDDTSTANELPTTPVRPVSETPLSRPSVPPPAPATSATPSPSQSATAETSTDRPAPVAETATPANRPVDREESQPRARYYHAAQRLHPGYQAAIGVADIAGVGQILRTMIGTYEAVKSVALQLELARKEQLEEKTNLSHAAAVQIGHSDREHSSEFPSIEPKPEKPLEEEPEASDRTLESAIADLDRNTDPRHLSRLGDRIVAALRPTRSSTQENAPAATKRADGRTADESLISGSKLSDDQGKAFPTAISTPVSAHALPQVSKKFDSEEVIRQWNIELMGEDAAEDWEQLGKTTMRLPKGWKPDPQPQKPTEHSEPAQKPAEQTETKPEPPAGAKPAYPDKIDPDEFLRSLKIEALGEEGAKQWDAIGKPREDKPESTAQAQSPSPRKSWWPSIRRMLPSRSPASAPSASGATVASEAVAHSATAAASQAPIAATGVSATAGATGATEVSGAAAGAGATGLAAAAGPVVIAFAAIAAAAVGVGIGLKMLSNAARSQADELEQYSAAIAKQRAETDVRRQLRDIERANGRGETLAKIGGAQDRLGEAFQRLGDALIDPLIDILAELTPVIEGAAYGVTKTAEGITIGIDQLRLIGAQLNDWLNLAGSEAEQDKRVRDIEKRLADRWTEFLTDEKKKRLDDALKNDPMLDALNNAWGQNVGMDPQLMRELIAAVRAL